MPDNKFSLNADRPKQNPWEDDALGYAPFAKHVADLIKHLDAPNGYVIGLHGEWGSGKTTAINFVLANLNKHNQEHPDDKIVAIEFRPWIVSGQQDLVSAFFKVLAEKLEELPTAKRSLWRKLKRAVGIVHGAVDKAVEASATIAVAADPTGGIVSGFAGGLARNSMQALANRLLKEPSLQAAYEELSKQLAAGGTRFLVTIDDIVRLEASEIRAIMRLVKSIGSLPNVVYLLAYDRQIVWPALDQGMNTSGPRFAEKIVQQEIDLPRPSRHRLLKLLDEEIGFVSDGPSDSMRWYHIVHDGLFRWLRSPRDVVRLTNAVKVSWPALAGEIDPQDLLAMEGLRLFDPEVFTWIRNNRDLLLKAGRFVLNKKGRVDAATKALEARVADHARLQVLPLLSALFPQFSEEEDTGNRRHTEYASDAMRRRGVAVEAGYDAYFGLHPSEDAIPKSIVDWLSSSPNDRSKIVSIFRGYLDSVAGDGELFMSKLLSELLYRYNGVGGAVPTHALIDAIFDVGEDILSIEWDGGRFSPTPRRQLEDLIDKLLQTLGPEVAESHLASAFEGCTSAPFLAEVYVQRGYELGFFGGSCEGSNKISVEALGHLGRVLLLKIEHAAREKTLVDAPYYWNVVRAWHHLDPTGTALAWQNDTLQRSPECFAKVARGLVARSYSAAGMSYEFSMPQDSTIYDIGLLRDAGEAHLQNADLSEDHRRVIQAVVTGAKRAAEQESTE